LLKFCYTAETRRLSRVHTLPTDLDLDFQNLITSAPVAKDMTDEVL